MTFCVRGQLLHFHAAVSPDLHLKLTMSEMVVSHCLSDRSTLMFPAAGGAGQFPGSFGCCAARLSPQRPSHPAWSPWQPAGQVETSEL